MPQLKSSAAEHLDLVTNPGITGNINSHLVDIPFKRTNREIIPDSLMTIASDVITAGTAFQSHVLNVTVVPTSVMIGQSVKVGVDYYRIFAVTASSITIETPLSMSVALTGTIYSFHNRLDGSFSGDESFTRASSATYIDALDGLVKTAAPNEMRFERMSDGGTGVLLEGASTNIILHSDLTTAITFNQANWTIGNTTTAPDGTIIEGFTTNINNATDPYIINPGLLTSPAGGRTFTYSIWSKGSGLSVGKSASMFFYVGSSVVSSAIILTASWQRTIFTYTAATGDLSTAIQGRFDIVNSNVDPVAGNDIVYCWGMQIEELPFASSYIPTTTVPVTRNNDILYIPASGNIPSHYLPHTILFDVDIKGSIAPYSNFMQMYIYNGITSFNMFRIENQTLVAYHGSGLPLMAYTPNGKTNRACKVVDGVSVRGFIDGTIAGTQIGSLIDNPSPNIIVSGAFMHIRNFRIYDKALTAAEIALA